MIELIQFIKKFQDIDRNTEEAILDSFVEEKAKKNEYILEEGKICSKISFIKCGLVRRYYVWDDKEITKW